MYRIESLKRVVPGAIAYVYATVAGQECRVLARVERQPSNQDKVEATLIGGDGTLLFISKTEFYTVLQYEPGWEPDSPRGQAT